MHTCFVEHGCRGPAFVCACVQKYVPRGGSPPFVLAWATKGALSRVGYHEISPADIPGFLSIYKDLYRRTADTLASPLALPTLPRRGRETNVSPRGGPRGPGSTSLPEKGRIKLRRDKLAGKKGGGGAGRKGEAEDPGRRSDKRKPTLRCSSSCEVFGFSVSRTEFRNILKRQLNVQVSFGTKRTTRRCYDFRSFVPLIAKSLVFVCRVVKDTTRFRSSCSA